MADANVPKEKSSKKVFLVVGIVVVVLLIAGGLIFYLISAKPKPTPQPAPVTKITTPKAPNYDGIYTGTAPAVYGLSDATVALSGTKITGSGTYLGAYNAQIALSITGTVDAKGNVSGSFSGSGVVQGTSVTGAGTYTGSITGNAISVTYTATGAGETHNGSIVLTKK